MAALDLFLYIAGGVIAAVLTILGGTISSTKPGQKRAFIGLGASSLVIYVWIGIRASNESKAASATAARDKQEQQQKMDEIRNQLTASEIKRASDTWYLEGKLEVFGQFAPAVLELAKASKENTRKQYKQKLLTNKELRELVGEVVKKMRDWQFRYSAESEKLANKYTQQRMEMPHVTAENSAAWQQKILQAEQAEGQEYSVLKNRYEREFSL